VVWGGQKIIDYTSILNLALQVFAIRREAGRCER
jgi:hypothetical protein